MISMLDLTFVNQNEQKKIAYFDLFIHKEDL